jgi:hypothetical protein
LYNILEKQNYGTRSQISGSRGQGGTEHMLMREVLMIIEISYLNSSGVYTTLKTKLHTSKR